MISICMIVKDEAEILERSLKSLSKCDYEIIIVDTEVEQRIKNIVV